MNKTVKISKELAENLLDNTNELLQGIIDFRKYPRYDRMCTAYEKEIAELKEAIENDS